MADTAQTLQAALEQAALVGSFAPARLLRSVTPQPDARAFAALGEYCQEVPVGPRVEWTLKPDRRREVLLRLKEEGRLADVASKSVPLAEDAFGHFLAGAVRGDACDTAQLSRPELGAMHSAMQFASTVVDTGISAETVQVQLARRDAEEALDLVLPTRLVGRDAELRRLVAFASEPAANPVIEPMYVTGCGGSGKSALLAEFTRVTRGPAWSGTPVITLDFDRPSIGTADGIEMILEFSRQLGLHRADLAPAMANFRRVVGEIMQYGSERKGDSYEVNASMESRVWSLWNEMLGATLPLMQPVVVILDTFEEVSVRGEEDAAYVLRWLTNLAVEGRMWNLHPVVSGRAVPQAESEDAKARHIPLDDLDPNAAGELLQLLASRSRRTLGGDLCDRVVQRVGGNALMLRIVSDFLAQEGEEAVEDLLKAGPNSPGGHVLSQAYLYGRILRRIRTEDKEIVKIAHPGLALRRVTVDLIRQVLAPACELGTITQERADELFRKLTRQVWLVEPTTNREVVRHRRHVRVQMMRALSGVDSDSMRKVHEAALAFYRDGLERFASRDEARLEACYHSLFTNAPEVPSPSEIKSFVASLEREVECIPLPGRAVLKFAAKMSLSPDETASLSHSQRMNYTQQRVAKKLSRGHVDEAAREAAGSAPESAPAEASDPVSGFAMKYAQGELRTAADLAVPLLRSYLDSAARGNAPDYFQTRSFFVETPVWYAALVVPKEETRDLVERCETALAFLLRDRRAQRRERGVAQALELQLLTGLLGGRIPSVPGAPRFQWELIDDLNALRAYQLLAEPGTAVTCRAGLLQNLSRPFLVLASGPGPAHALQLRVSHVAASEVQLAITEGRRLSATAERELSGPAQLHTRQGVPLNPWEVELMLGLTPELYAPLRGLLHRLPEDVLEAFVEDCEPLPTWPQAVRGAQFRSRLKSDRSRAEADLISTADRLGGLLPFAEYCAASATDRSPFQEFLGVARRYQATLRRQHTSPPAPQKGKSHADPT